MIESVQRRPGVLLLASGSRHRAGLLSRLGLPFESLSADVDERPLPGESVLELVRRLGQAKARRVATLHPGHLVIGSDQSVSLATDGDDGGVDDGGVDDDREGASDRDDGRGGGDAATTLGKPGTQAAARAQLASLSGRRVTFLTSLSVIDARSGNPVTAPATHDVDRTVVTVRTLDEREIERYTARDDALDCAGAFRVESLGIALFERIDSRDPTALTGLPLIRLAARLRAAGLAVP